MGSSYSPPASDPTAATPYSDEVNSVTTFSTPSLTPVLVTGGTSMTITPPAGTYLVLFGGSAFSDTAADAAILTIYAGGSPVTGASRSVFADIAGPPGNPLSFLCSAKVTVNGAEAIEGRASIAALGAASVLERNLIITAVEE